MAESNLLDIRMVWGTEIVEVHKLQAVALNFISKYISYLDILNVCLRDLYLDTMPI